MSTNPYPSYPHAHFQQSMEDVRASSTNPYDVFARVLKKRVTTTGPFSAFITITILAVGAATGADLSVNDDVKWKEITWYDSVATNR